MRLTRIDPFHAIRVVVRAVLLVVGDSQTIRLCHGTVRVKVISSVAGVGDDGVGVGEADTQ